MGTNFSRIGKPEEEEWPYLQAAGVSSGLDCWRSVV